MMRIGGLLLSVSVCFSAGGVRAQSADLYAATEDIVDSLRSWSLASPVDSTGGEPLLLGAAFPGATVSRLDTADEWMIELPPYMGILASSLILRQGAGPLGGDLAWAVPLATDSSGALWIDARVARCDEHVARDSAALRYLSERLAMLRTVGLPAASQAGGPDLCLDSVWVHVRGNHVEIVPFTHDSWRSALSRVARGRQVYATLVDAIKDSAALSFRFCVLIAAPGAKAHHFLVWSERAMWDGTEWLMEAAVVALWPFVRTDNVLNLFAQAGETRENAFPVHLGREPGKKHREE